MLTIFHPFWIVSLFLTDKKVNREKVDQRNCARTFEMLTVAFCASTMSRTQVQLWYNRFKEGREDVNDDDNGNQDARERQINIGAVKKMILDNC